MKKIYLFLIPIFALIIISAFAFIPNLNSDSNNVGINYQGNVCHTVTRADGTVEPTECNHNVLYNTGAEGVEQLVGAGAAADAYDWIELCNATAGCGTPVAAKTESYTALVGCGMDNVVGTYGSNGNGNWSIWKEFTSTCANVETNVTRLRNDADVDLAGNTFTLVTLASGDKLLINWTITVS